MKRILALIAAALRVLHLAPAVPRPKFFEIPPEIQARVDATMSRNRAVYGGYSMNGNVVLERLRKDRQAQFDYIDRVTSDVEAAGRDLSDTERESIQRAQERVEEIDAQIEPLAAFEQLRDANEQTTRRFTPTAGDGDGGEGSQALGAQVTEREHKYRSAGEFMADVMRAVPGSRHGAGGEKLSQAARTAAAERLRTHGFTVESGMLVRADPPHNTTTEVPGLLPEPIIGSIMSDIDAARPFISSIGARDLGGIPGTTFERPTISQHVAVAKQTAEKATVTNQQFEVEGVPFTKDTYGGYANVSRQSIDWTSPGVWDALLSDFQEVYAVTTENAAADAFATAVVQTQELGTAETIAETTLQELLVALYAAAGKAYQGSGRLPDTIWASLDWWAVLGPLMDYMRASTGGDGGGDSSISSFSGNLLKTDRIVVPSFANGTLVVGVKSRTEVYEDRFGFLTSVEPKVFGVELAYGGYMASGTIKPAAFCKIVPKPGA